MQLAEQIKNNSKTLAYIGSRVNKLNFVLGGYMDKSFNDQELSDIMKEIEALEHGFTSDFKTKSEDSAVMQELAEMEEAQSVPVSATKKDAPVLPFENKAAKTSKNSSMTFKVEGDLNLELQFEVNGKIIKLELSEKNLNIEMEGGVTFSVPVSDAQSLKKAV